MGHEREGGNAQGPIGARARRKRGSRRCMIRTVAAWAVIRTKVGRKWLQREPRRSLAALDLVPTFSAQLNNWRPWRPWIVPSSSGQEIFRAMSCRRYSRNELMEPYDERAHTLSRCFYSSEFSLHTGSRVQPFRR